MSEHQRKQFDPPDHERHTKRPRHESGEPVARRPAGAPRSGGVQAHRDIERGLEDTDLRGGHDYQERTQNDAHANCNSDHARRSRYGRSSGRKG